MWDYPDLVCGNAMVSNELATRLFPMTYEGVGQMISPMINSPVASQIVLWRNVVNGIHDT
jgi:hypothetical protein